MRRGLARRQVDAHVGKDLCCFLAMPAMDYEVTVGIVERRELYPDVTAVTMNPEDAKTSPLRAHLDGAIVQSGEPSILEGEPCASNGMRSGRHHASRILTRGTFNRRDIGREELFRKDGRRGHRRG